MIVACELLVHGMCKARKVICHTHGMPDVYKLQIKSRTGLGMVVCCVKSVLIQLVGLGLLTLPAY